MHGEMNYCLCNVCEKVAVAPKHRWKDGFRKEKQIFYCNKKEVYMQI